MKNAFQDRKSKLKDFKEDLVQLNFIKEKNSFTSSEIPSDVVMVCKNCKESILTEDFKENLMVCPKCGYHSPLHMEERRDSMLDSYEEFLPEMEVKKFTFEGYQEKYIENQKKTGLHDALGCYYGKIKDVDVALAILDSGFMMASMGSVVGEKLTRFIENAMKRKLPLVIFCASGGARMQEGIISLMQMAKTSAVVQKYKDQGLLYISILTYPTTGGVSASFASLGDITLAEPEALIGFAGKRVIENTIKEHLPKEFQTAEFLLEKGFLDRIVERKHLKDMIYKLLKMHKY